MEFQDTVYERFSEAEYERRHEAVREFVKQQDLDCLLVTGGCGFWSAGHGVFYLSNFAEHFGTSSYVVFPRVGEPTLIISMGGGHLANAQRVSVIKDVRESRLGRHAEVISERLKELGIEEGRIGISECDGRLHDLIPLNHYNTLREKLPKASFEFVSGFFNELWRIKSPEEMKCVERATQLCDIAIEAIVKKAKIGVTEYQLRAAAYGSVMDAGGEIAFVLVGATSMSNPTACFPNPNPSSRTLKQGDIILTELGAKYQGFEAQIGRPITLGEPTERYRTFYDKIVVPTYKRVSDQLRTGKTIGDIMKAGSIIKENGYTISAPLTHGEGLSTDGPLVTLDRSSSVPPNFTFKPNMTMMVESNPATPDRQFGIFLGDTFAVTEGAPRCLSEYPQKIVVI